MKVLKEQYSHGGNIGNKIADEGETDDTENTQDSMSEDDSDDDTDRKGMYKPVISITYWKQNKCRFCSMTSSQRKATKGCCRLAHNRLSLRQFLYNAER